MNKTLIGKKVKKNRGLLARLEKNPPLFFLASYLITIGLGAFLLTMPFSSKAGHVTNWIDALFISSSATCVTGLSPLVTAEYWSSFGKCVIIILIQLGGLGVMTAVAMIGLIAGQSFSLANRRILMEEKNQEGLSGAVKLIRFILLSTFIIEGTGAFLMSFYFVPIYGIKGIFYALFHSISAFCNAGFDILGPVSLSSLASNPYILFIISALIVIAGLGYGVYLEIIRWPKRRRFSLHAKIVLSMTLFLLVLGTVMTYILEKDNLDTLGSMSQPTKILNSFFQSVTCRTAGFYTFAQERMSRAASLVSIFLMFIGGSPAGTAGGIKTTSFLAVIILLFSNIRSSQDTDIFNRNIAKVSLKNAQTVFIVSIMWNFLIIFLLTITEEGSLLDLSFEAISAFGTVGLSRNFTASLSGIGKIILSISMLAGKLGTITLLHALIPVAGFKKNRLAEERILIG